MNKHLRLFFQLAFPALLFATLTGCVERTITITSEPPGALVYLNDREIGRTPCQTDFKFYGTYAVRLTLDGYEPYTGPGDADAPLYQQPGLDLLADLIPLPFHDTVNWHFDLRKVDTSPEKMLDRAEQLRSKMNQNQSPDTSSTEDKPPSTK